MLSDDEAEEIKQKLLSHIESTFPAEQIMNAKQQIEAMNSEQLEKFLEKNRLMKEENEDVNSKNDCVFCSIASGKIQAVKIDENEEAVAVLEINPISRGHSIVIPKSHEDKPSKEALSLAKKVSKKIEKKLKPKNVEISESKLFGHGIINILPVYDKENFKSERKSAKTEELEKIREELDIEDNPKKERKKIKTKKIKEISWLPKRIP
jgi:histidine triad (HIT) family protein